MLHKYNYCLHLSYMSFQKCYMFRSPCNVNIVKYLHSINSYYGGSGIYFYHVNRYSICLCKAFTILVNSFHQNLDNWPKYNNCLMSSKQMCSQDSVEDVTSEKDQFSYGEFEFMTDDKFQELVCPQLYISSDDPVLYELSNVATLQDIFKMIHLNKHKFTKSYAVQAILSLSTLKTVAEENKLNQKFYASSQSLSQAYSTKVSENLKACSEFNIVLSTIQNEVTKLSNEELAATFICLNNLEFCLHDSIMTALHLKILENIPRLDLLSLARISFVFRNKGIKAYYSQAKMLTIILSKFDACSSLDDLGYISFIIANSKKLLSTDLKLKYFALLQNFLNKNLLNDCSVSFKILFLKYVHLLAKNDFPMEICRLLASSLIDDVSSLSPGQIITLNFSLLKQQEPRNLLLKLQEFTSRIYSDYEDDADLQSDLLLCHFFHPKIGIKEQFNKKFSVQKKVSLHNKFNYGIMKQFNIKDIDLYKNVWNEIMNETKRNLFNSSKVDEGIGARERILFNIYGQYISLNSYLNGNCRNRDIEAELVNLVKEELLNLSSFIPTKLAHLSGFLLAYSNRNVLNKEFFEKLQNVAMQFNSYDIVFLSKCVKCFFWAKDKNLENRKMVANVCRLLDETTESLIKNCSSLGTLSALTKAYLLRQSSPTSFLFDNLIHKHLCYLDCLNSSTIQLSANILKESQYVIPEMCEAFSDYVIQHEESILPRTIYQILSYFYLVGFHPLKCEEFTNSCIRVLEMTCEKIECQCLLESCLTLSFLKNLSAELIHYIFNTKFLDQLEEEIYSSLSKKYSSELKLLLMQLNRAVCLDFPEEKVPWFHEEFCRKHSVQETSYLSDFHNDVYNILISILGNEHLVSVNRKSPYYYNLDLEFALDRNGKPVPIYSRNLGSSKSSIAYLKKEAHKRVAVQIRDEDSYSCNNRSLTGVCLMERRHLEILGYAVVEVPHFLWYSMAFTDDDDKRKLLKTLIYKELSRIS